MKKPENTFAEGVNGRLPVSLHREKMNNPYNSGTADWWYSGNLRDLWIEFKFLHKLNAKAPHNLCAGKEPQITKLQQEWLAGRYGEGRNVWVILGLGNGRDSTGVLFKSGTWAHTYSPAELYQMSMSRHMLSEQITRFCCR